MKKYLIMCAALLMGAVCLTSCSDDDEEKTILYHNTGELPGGGTLEITVYETPKMLKSIAEWKLADTRLEKISRLIPSKDEETYIFDKNDLCTKATRTTTFRSEEDAQMMYENMTANLDEDGKRNYSLKGKVLNEDMTYQFLSGPKDEIRAWLLKKTGL